MDGIFGPGTERALKAYQTDNGLAADGTAGPDTFSEMGLHELVLLRKGQRGATVKRLQEALSIGADGIFGSGTERAVIQFQTENGFAADGIAGPRTLAAMDFFEEFTEEVVMMSTVPEDYVEPEIPTGFEMDEVVIAAGQEASAEAEKAEEKEDKGIWGTVKGWFS